MQYYVATSSKPELYGDSPYWLAIRPSITSMQRYIEENTSQPWRYCVRPATWEERERGHFYEGHYEHPPWCNERFWANSEVHTYHYAHISVDDPTQIAFTETPEKGEQDRQLRMKPGRYLQRYFGDILTAKQIAFYAEWFVRGDRPIDMDDGTEVNFASTPDDIVTVYSDGPESCMLGDYYPRVYGAGDLAIAYTGPMHSVSARALCWPEKKVFGRVYPDTSCSRDQAGLKLFTALRGRGWKHISEESEIFDGARLLKIPLGGDKYVMPYLDNGYMVDDEGDYFTMQQNGQYDGPDQYGVIALSGSCHDFICDRCDDGYDDDEHNVVYTDWSPDIGAHDSRSYCNYCRNERAFYCHGSDETYTMQHCNSVTVVTSHGERAWVEEYADEHAFYCNFTSTYYDKDDFTEVVLANGETWEREAFDENGWVCAYDNGNYANDEKSTLFPGFPASLDHVDLPAAVRCEHIILDGDFCYLNTQQLQLPLAA